MLRSEKIAIRECKLLHLERDEFCRKLILSAANGH